MSIAFSLIPDAEGHPLRGPLTVWLTERYEREITLAADWIGKRVEILVAGAADFNQYQHNGKTGKVTAVALLLNDDRLFRYAVKLDKGGQTVEGVADGDFFFSALSDAEAGLSRGPGGTVTMTDPKMGASHTMPLVGWEMKPYPPAARYSKVGRRVRVTDATSHPGTYLQEGFVAKESESQKVLGVRLNNGAYLTYHESELRFL